MFIYVTGTYNSLHIEFVSIIVVPYYIGHMYRYYTWCSVERDCNTITVLLLLLLSQINNQSIKT